MYATFLGSRLSNVVVGMTVHSGPQARNSTCQVSGSYKVQGLRELIAKLDKMFDFNGELKGPNK